MDILHLLKLHWDRATAAALVVVGIVALALGWSGASDVVYPSQQIPYLISGGIGGLFCLGVAGTLWLSADLRDEWRKLDELAREDPAGDAPIR